MCKTFFSTVPESMLPWHINSILWTKWGQLLCRELLPQILIIFHEIWHRCSSEDVNVQNAYFGSGKKCIAMVTKFVQNIGENPSLQNCFLNIQTILVEFIVNACLMVSQHNTFFRQWPSRVLPWLQLTYYEPNDGKSCLANYFLSFFLNRPKYLERPYAHMFVRLSVCPSVCLSTIWYPLFHWSI